MKRLIIDFLLVSAFITGLAVTLGSISAYHWEHCEKKTIQDFVIKADGKAYLADVQYCK